jgi:Xaa-Pro aminopeptidase
MTSELLGLGLIDKADVQNENPDWPAYKKYFMHGTSHHMGLDTHYGILTEPMQANMVSQLSLEFISCRRIQDSSRR